MPVPVGYIGGFPSSGIAGPPGPPGAAAPSLNAIVYRASGGDDQPALQALVDASPGRRIVLPDALYLLAHELWITLDNVLLVGQAMGWAGIIYPVNGTTTLRRITNAGGAVVKFGALNAPPYAGALTGVPPWGGGVSGLNLDAGTLADYALNIDSASDVTLTDYALAGGVIASLRLGARSYSGAYEPNNYARKIKSHHLHIRNNVAGSKGILLTGNPLAAGGEDAFECDFYDTYGVVDGAGATALYVENADNNNFYGFNIAGTAASIDLRALARNIAFFGGLGMYDGNPSAIIARTGSRQNTIYGLGTEDVTTQVVIEQGADLRVIYDHGHSTFTPDLRSIASIKEEFVGGGYAISSGGWGVIGEQAWHVVVAAGTNIGQISPPAGRFGIRSLETSATSGSTTAIALAQAEGLLVAADHWDLLWGFALQQADANTICRVGFCAGGQHADDPPASGIYLEKLAGDTSWFGVCRNAGSQTRSAALQAVSAAAWVKCQFKHADAATVAFVLGNKTDGQVSANVSANLPTAALTPFAQIKNSAAANKVLYVDFMRVDLLGIDR